jgi:IstB-like ATP binding protein
MARLRIEPIDQWHGVIGDPTYADAILDRLVHNAHRINLAGDSLRRNAHPRPLRTIDAGTRTGPENHPPARHRPWAPSSRNAPAASSESAHMQPVAGIFPRFAGLE